MDESQELEKQAVKEAHRDGHTQQQQQQQPQQQQPQQQQQQSKPPLQRSSNPQQTPQSGVRSACSALRQLFTRGVTQQPSRRLLGLDNSQPASSELVLQSLSVLCSC